jgi:hypothetical protein
MHGNQRWPGDLQVVHIGGEDENMNANVELATLAKLVVPQEIPAWMYHSGTPGEIADEGVLKRSLVSIGAYPYSKWWSDERILEIQKLGICKLGAEMRYRKVGQLEGPAK